ncbi:MAG: hypothetical protein IJW66_03460 [Clostridia bacterium]|nr:hypothetical protein [Clostridia bacterium]
MIKTDISLPLFYTDEDIFAAVTASLPVERCEILDFSIVKRSLVLSDKSNIHYKTTVALAFSEERERGLLKMKKRVSQYPDYTITLPAAHLGTRPVVCGFGPAGMFSALALAEAGARPIVIERGLDIDARNKRVSLFSKMGILDTECNVQYGEGGAGSYSDGKLKVGSMDKYKMYVLKALVSAGANPDILFSSTAHVGTDVLSGVVKKIRERIISLGGEVRFGVRLEKINLKSRRVCSVTVGTADGSYDIECETLIMATGHSAKDSFEALMSAGATLVKRPFGVGMRIEHSREYIDGLIYGKDSARPAESASYHLVTHLPSGRSVYSFCMCPGGTVVAAANEEGGIVTNGMSEYARDADNSNSALLVSVTPDDFEDGGPLSGLDFQRKIERAAYALTESYRAPAERLSHFMREQGENREASVRASYPIGTYMTELDSILPSYITDSVRAGIIDFDKWLPGFYHPDAILTSPETRTTSPVRVVRGESLEAEGIGGLYPAGEGAGYAGGIISSARDGLLVAEAILTKNAN